MRITKDRPRPRPHRLGPEDFDERGRYRYPGDVEDAMPEGNLALNIACYLRETILRLVCDPEHDSAYQNLPIYLEKGTRHHVAPDVFFLAGVPFEIDLKSYLLWKTDVPPAVVFEIVSAGSEIKDVVRNREIYARLGVAEYYWFHPETLDLMALRLDPATSQYRKEEPGEQGRYSSPALGLEVGVEGNWVALYAEGEYIPPTEELRRQAERDREEAERRCEEAERRCEEAERRSREERRRREEAEQGGQEERRRREEAERRIEELERRLREAERGGV